MNRWEWLISNAKLEIYEFSVDRHESYIVENRYFPFYVMSYIQEGGASAILDGKLYDTPVGHLVLIPAYTRHSHFIPEVERFFRRIKRFRRVFTRYDKLDIAFAGFSLFAMIFDSLVRTDSRIHVYLSLSLVVAFLLQALFAAF